MEKTKFKEKLRQKFLSYKPDFDLKVLEKGIDKFQLMECKAGSLIAKKGEKCQKIFIAEKSITRCYCVDEKGNEMSMWIEPEMSLLTEFYTFKTGEISNVDIHLYEDSMVYFIEREDLLNLYLAYHDWCIIGVLILEEILQYTMKLSHMLHFNDATENYKLIESDYLRYLHVVPLKHIASRLNISPVHLSRIRAKQYDK